MVFALPFRGDTIHVHFLSRGDYGMCPSFRGGTVYALAFGRIKYVHSLSRGMVCTLPVGGYGMYTSFRGIRYVQFISGDTVMCTSSRGCGMCTSFVDFRPLVL